VLQDMACAHACPQHPAPCNQAAGDTGCVGAVWPHGCAASWLLCVSFFVCWGGGGGPPGQPQRSSHGSQLYRGAGAYLATGTACLCNLHGTVWLHCVYGSTAVVCRVCVSYHSQKPGWAVGNVCGLFVPQQRCEDIQLMCWSCAHAMCAWSLRLPTRRPLVAGAWCRHWLAVCWCELCKPSSSSSVCQCTCSCLCSDPIAARPVQACCLYGCAAPVKC
jgi:hypothetical protein